MSTRMLLTAPPRKGILQQNVNLENEKENQEQPPQRKGVILMTPKQEPFDDDDDWKSSPRRGYVTNTDGGLRRRHKLPSIVPQSTPPSHVIARRNERERNRVRQVNDSFSVLRSRIPEYLYDTEVDEKGKQTRRKLSKVETLRLAVDYIQQLEGLLNIKQESRLDDSEEDGFFSSAENTQGSLFRAESEAELSPEGVSQDESSCDAATPNIFGQLEATDFNVEKFKEDLFLVGAKRKCADIIEEEPSDLESAVGSPLPPISESFPSKLSYDLYVPYALVDLSAKAD